jgi:hypothetical protein
MKLFLTMATLATLLLSASVQAKKMKSIRSGGKGGGPDTYIALLSAAQALPGCTSSALGNAIVTVQDDEFCIKLSYSGLSASETKAHVHGPAAVGDSGPLIFALDTPSTQKMQCFDLTSEEDYDDLDDGLWYFNVHSAECPDGEIRGQILPL